MWDVVPHRAATIGMKEILSSRYIHVTLLRNWHAGLWRRAFLGPVTGRFPRVIFTGAPERAGDRKPAWPQPHRRGTPRYGFEGRSHAENAPYVGAVRPDGGRVARLWPATLFCDQPARPVCGVERCCELLEVEIALAQWNLSGLLTARERSSNESRRCVWRGARQSLPDPPPPR